MTSFVEIDGKKFQNVKDAASLSGYSRDYIGRLAREKKIAAHQIGRQWFVSMDSLENYAKLAEQELRDRQQKLSEQRRSEHKSATKGKKRRTRGAGEKKEKNKIKTVALSVTVLALGVGLGVFINVASSVKSSPAYQVASAPQDPVFLQNQKEFPIATGEVEESITLEAMDFSKESVTISTLDGDGYGVMLLPSSSEKEFTEAEVRAMFSDPVHIVNDEEGNQYVVRTKANGVQERLPFAVVPVNNQETP